MEAAVMLGASPAVSLVIGRRSVALESSMRVRVGAVPRRRRGVMRDCVGVAGLGGEAVKKVVSEIKAERSEPPKSPSFSLQDLYGFIWRSALVLHRAAQSSCLYLHRRLLPHSSREKKLSASNPGNKLLEMRGNAGSHDLKLGPETLKALRCLTTSGKEVKLPRYNKSANAGLGDRADP